jgi:hypothetical protein
MLIAEPMRSLVFINKEKYGEFQTGRAICL